MAKGIEEIDVLNKRIYFGVNDSSDETEYSVQEVGSYIVEELKKQHRIHVNEIFSWSGFDLLPLGDRTGIVLILLDGWTIWTRDQPSPHSVRFSKGVISTDSELFPLGQPANVNWLLAESTVSSLQNVDTIENVERHIEKRTHGVGKTFYWNPVNGSDGNDGKWSFTPCKTFKHIHDNLCTSGNNDVIYCVTPDVDGIVTITEKIDITKSNIHLRGEGNRHVIAPTEQGDAVRIIGTSSSPIFGVEFSGFRVEVPTVGANLTAPFNSGNQANLHMHWAYNANVHDCHFMFGQGNGIQFHFCQNAVLENLDIHENPNTGMFIWNTKNSQINNVRIFNNGGSGIRIQSDENWSGTPIPDWYVTNVVFREVKVYDNLDYGIRFTEPTFPTLGAGDALGEIEELLLDFSTFIGENGLGRTNNDTLTQQTNHDNDIVNKIAKQGGSGRTMDK